MKKDKTGLADMAAQQLAALGNMGQGASTGKQNAKTEKDEWTKGWSELESSSPAKGLSGDLAFNDLEIQFDDQK